MSSWWSQVFGTAEAKEAEIDSDESDSEEKKTNDKQTEESTDEPKIERLYIPRGHIMTINKNYEQLLEQLIAHEQQKVIVVTHFEPPAENVGIDMEKIEKNVTKKHRNRVADDDDFDFGFFPPDMRGTYSPTISNEVTRTISASSRRTEGVDIDFNTTIELYSAFGTLIHKVHSRPDLAEKTDKQKKQSKSAVKKSAVQSALNDHKITCCKLVASTAQVPNEDLKKKKVSPLRYRTDTFSFCIREPFVKSEQDEDDEEQNIPIQKNPIIDKVEALHQKPAHFEGVAYMLVLVSFPMLDIELKSSQSSELVRHSNGQLSTTKVVIRKTPRTNRFVTRVLVIDPKATESHLSPLEICRFTSSVDNYERLDKDRHHLVGMFHIAPPAWVWQFRSSNHYRPIPPRKLRIKVHKISKLSKVLSISSALTSINEDNLDGEDNGEYNSYVQLGNFLINFFTF
jgi:hypothetical protein